MPQTKSLQTIFLNELQKEQLLVSIFLVNGIKLHGMVVAYDDDVIMLKNAVPQVVYKHAISTIVPSRQVTIPS